MLKSIKRRGRLSELVKNLEKKEYINWNDWKNNELQQLCNFYINCGFCERIENTAQQYTAFLFEVTKRNSYRQKMLQEIISLSPGLKQYLQVHSVFRIDVLKKGDWLEREMVAILLATDDDVINAHKKEYVPQWVLDKFKLFDPEPFGIEIDPIRIEYEFWGRRDPIDVIDTDWEKIKGPEIDVEKFLTQFDPIGTNTVQRTYVTEDDELPF